MKGNITKKMTGKSVRDIIKNLNRKGMYQLKVYNI